MADMTENPANDAIIFDIYNDDLLQNNTILSDNLPQDEKEEMANIVQALDSINSYGKTN